MREKSHTSSLSNSAPPSPNFELVSTTPAFGTLVEEFVRARMELEEMRMKLEALERVNARLLRFSHAAAHDLQAPLRHISAFAEILEADHGPHLDDKARELVTSVRRSGQRAHALVAELLAQAKADGGAPDYAEVDLNALVASIREELSGTVAGETVAWEVDALPSVPADETLARMLLENLISNAVKFSAGEATPRIAVRREAPGAEDALLGVEHVIVVRDNGVGFAPEDATRLFEMFWRGGDGDERTAGMGIGLSTVAEIAAAHGWLVRVWGELGEGAEFRVLM